MSFNDWDVPVDMHRVYRVMAEINQKRPLKGGVLDRPTKSTHCTAEGTEVMETYVHKNASKATTTRKCAICRKPTDGNLYCSRACVLKRQRDIFGATLQELAANHDLPIPQHYAR